MKPVMSHTVAIVLTLTVVLTACGNTTNTETALAEPPPSSSTKPPPTSPPDDREGSENFATGLGHRVEPANLDWGELDLNDQRLFTIMSEINETFRNGASEIWSEKYRLDRIPLSFAYRSSDGTITKMYVLHHPAGASLPGAVRVELDESLGLGEVYSIDAPDKVASLADWIPFEFNADIGGTSSMLFFIPENDPFLSPQTWDFARFVVHEAFHRHQLIDSGWSTEPPDGNEYPRDAHNAALALLEDRVLVATDNATDDDEIRRRLAQFLAIRRYRTEQFDLGNLETVQELAEGTARYVENRYAELNGRPRHPTTGVGAMVSLDWLAFGRFYDSGARLGHALEHLGADWKNAVAEGIPLTNLAYEEISDTNLAETNLAEQIKEAKAEFGYTDILTEVEAADLRNAEFHGPAASIDEAQIAQCLADNGVPIDDDLDSAATLETLLNRIDIFDSEVSAALRNCGIGITNAPPGASTR